MLNSKHHAKNRTSLRGLDHDTLFLNDPLCGQKLSISKRILIVLFETCWLAGKKPFDSWLRSRNTFLNDPVLSLSVLLQYWRHPPTSSTHPRLSLTLVFSRCQCRPDKTPKVLGQSLLLYGSLPSSFFPVFFPGCLRCHCPKSKWPCYSFWHLWTPHQRTSTAQ